MLGFLANRGTLFVLTLDVFQGGSDSQLAQFDIAEVNLACAADLPGSENLDQAACLAWLEKTAAWGRTRWTRSVRSNSRGRAIDRDGGRGRAGCLQSPSRSPSL